MDFSDILRRAEAWKAGDCDAATIAEVAALIAAKDEAELTDRFGTSLEFGTAGLRGTLGTGTNRMNRAVVRRTTAGLAQYLLDQVPDVKSRGVVIGRDGRTMSPEFAEDTASVLAAYGIPALVLPGVSPTPVTAFACLHTHAAGAVMVTASHNPPEYNGYKVYWENGAQIVPPHDKGIAAAIDAMGPAKDVPWMSIAQARAKNLYRDLSEDIGEAYLKAILNERLSPAAPKDFDIVYTAMHGVGGRWVKAALERAGFRKLHCVAEQQEPDARFPTVRFPNPEEPGAMDLAIALAEKTKATLVLANDPDADRLAVMARDDTGQLRALSGNEAGVMLGHYLLTARKPPDKPLVITTIVSSAQLAEIARQLGALYDETLTGFKWIANRAIERQRTEGANFLFGYEEALGLTVGTVVRDKDGVGAALLFADIAAWCKGRHVTLLGYLEEIQRQHGLFVAEQKNFTFPGGEGARLISGIMDNFRNRPLGEVGGLKVASAKDYLKRERRVGAQVEPLTLPASNVIAYDLEGGSRITLRPSGTEPKIKYYFELRENPAAGEPLGLARERAMKKLRALQEAFMVLARERGQPSV